MITITKPELQHIADLIEELEAIIDADTEEGQLIPYYLVERKDIVKQIVEEKYAETN